MTRPDTLMCSRTTIGMYVHRDSIALAPEQFEDEDNIEKQKNGEFYVFLQFADAIVKILKFGHTSPWYREHGITSLPDSGVPTSIMSMNVYAHVIPGYTQQEPGKKSRRVNINCIGIPLR